MNPICEGQEYFTDEYIERTMVDMVLHHGSDMWVQGRMVRG